ncbi:hypothetical protein ACQEVX_35445 [Streptomyces syringium]|uniref:hypothetical protein n=1 Tax=Streptomyces syringium TaxID=76729 RepID=UPI003D8A73B0
MKDSKDDPKPAPGPHPEQRWRRRIARAALFVARHAVEGATGAAAAAVIVYLTGR